MLSRAIRSFALGERQQTADSKKQAYVTVFDIFFALPGSATTKSIREGVAFTMYPIQNTLSDAERFKQAQFINRAYDSRSETTHEFQIGLFEPDDLTLLRLIAVNFIVQMWRGSPFQDKPAVHNWLQEQRDLMGPKRYSVYAALSRD
jgi:hypothetical protein